MDIKIISDFESASIGTVTQVSETEFRLGLKSDNNDDGLPDEFRNWWYVKLEHIHPDSLLTIHLHSHAHHHDYLPVYSYDGDTWFRFAEKDVKQSLLHEKDSDYHRITIASRFSHDAVYIARFYPYTLTRLQNYLQQFSANPYIKQETLGCTPQLKLPIYLLTISDFKLPDNNKKRIWLQARTHPAETGSSFLLEGFINFLLSDQVSAQKMRENFIYHIIPMQNPDGVVVGNYRTNLDSVDLERNWIFSANNPSELASQVALENRLLHVMIHQWLNPQDKPPISIALNLHSSNEPVQQPAFFFPHFGNIPKKYNQQQCTLYKQQEKLIRLVSRFYHDFYGGYMALPVRDGGDAFLKEYFPETWWWANRQNQVLAMTLETVYGKAGFDHWVTTNDIRNLGRALVYAITCYFKVNF